MLINIDVSIVIAAWNASQFIGNAIDSALQQQGVNIEVIVVDDYSTDNTCKVVEGYSDPRVKLIRSKKNGGPGAARNIGFTAARGEWIAVLDSDDYFQEGRLLAMLNANKQNADIVIDNVFEQYQGSATLTPRYQKNELPLGELTLAYLINTNLIYSKIKATGYIKPIFRRDFIVKHNLAYWPEVRIGEDYYFLACCLAKGAKAVVVDLCAYVYTIRAGSISGKMTIAHFERLLSGDEKFIGLHQFNDDEKLAQCMRTKNILRGKNFALLVIELKEKKMIAALKRSLCHVNAACLLWLPIRKRLLGY